MGIDIIVQQFAIGLEGNMTIIKTVELEIEYARMIFKMDEHTKEKERLQKKINEFKEELAVCNDQIDRLSVDIMTTTIKLAKTRGRTTK